MSHLSKEKKEYLNRLFIEAKWLYNHILSSKDVFGFDTKVKNVLVLNKDGEKGKRDLKCLSSQMKQGIKKRIQENIRTLSRLKKNGKKIGRLRFKSRVNSIPLPQFNCTYKIEDNNYVKIQGFSKHFKVIGFEQAPENVEFANATLVRKQEDYFLHLACFLPKEKKEFKEKSVGIDFGIKNNLTLSNGEKFNLQVPVSERTKRLQRKFKNKKKFSENWKRLRVKVQKSYRKTFDQKTDRKNKIVSYIVNTFETVCVQDENIKEWQETWFGKQIQRSMLGGIMSDLQRKSHTLSIVDKWFPSTQLCLRCGKLNAIGLDKRVYSCVCGYREDRDTHSAKNIEEEGLTGTGRISQMPVEISVGSAKQEAY